MRVSESGGALLKSTNGYYYGTTIGNSWWRRYTEKDWFSRGNAEIWVDNDGVHFHLYMTRAVRSIPAASITGIRIGKWHAGKWTGAPVIKIAWKKGGTALESGFAVSWSSEETDRWISVIRSITGKVLN